MRWHVWLLLMLAGMLACSGYSTGKLAGTWIGSSLTEEGEVLSVNAGDISFQFRNNGYYEFNSTVDYKEAGTFSLQGDLLYTLDTINEASTEKAVKIMELTSDSLIILMNAGGRQRILKLVKKR